MTVHRIGNCSDSDKDGRLIRFRAQTMCGLKLVKPRLVTDNAKQVTCRSCIRETGWWGNTR